MGERDILEKQYLQDSERFADAFNYYIYKGKQVINPDDLKEIGTDELAVPYGNNANEPVQRIRDAEYLSGFHKDDHLMPVVTLMMILPSLNLNWELRCTSLRNRMKAR